MLRSSNCADNELNIFLDTERKAIEPKTNTFLFVTDLGLVLLRLKLCLPARIDVYSQCCLQSVMWWQSGDNIYSSDMTVMRPLTQLTLALISSQHET